MRRMAPSSYEQSLNKGERMLVIAEQAQEFLDATKAFAESVGEADAFQSKLDYLDTYACHGDALVTKTHLYKDFAPFSFGFSITKRQKDGTYSHWFEGGLIYRGPGQPGDGSGPSFNVQVAPSEKVHSWSINT